MSHRRESSIRSFVAYALLPLGLLVTAPTAKTVMRGVSPTTTYQVDPQQSHFEVDVGRAGLFKMFGHDHVIEVRTFTGTVDWSPERPEDSRFRLEVDASSLRVADEEVSEEDRARIQADMESKALALVDHPTIVFESTRVKAGKREGAGQRLTVEGTLRLRGVEKSLEIPLTITVANDRLTAAGELKLESDEWGVPQISALGGSVKTKEELGLSFQIVALSS